MDVSFFAFCKEFDQKIRLHERFAACHGNAALCVKTFIALILFENFGHFHDGAACHCPGIGIVTVCAAHGTALYEYNESCARTVNGSEGFQ